MKPNPFSSFIRASFNLLRGRYYFPKNRIGEIIEYEGQKFTIFRQMILDPGAKERGDPQASFQVRFRVANMSPQRNKIFSRFTIPFFSGISQEAILKTGIPSSSSISALSASKGDEKGIIPFS